MIFVYDKQYNVVQLPLYQSLFASTNFTPSYFVLPRFGGISLSDSNTYCFHCPSLNYLSIAIIIFVCTFWKCSFEDEISAEYCNILDICIKCNKARLYAFCMIWITPTKTKCTLYNYLCIFDRIRLIGWISSGR